MEAAGSGLAVDVGEEAASAGDIPDVSSRLWLVDPIDGTKEFITGPGSGAGGRFYFSCGLAAP